MSEPNEELEQYGRRLCVPAVDNKTLDEVLDKVKSLIKEISFVIPDVVFDRAHQIGKGYNDKKPNVIKVLLYISQLCFIVLELI